MSLITKKRQEPAKQPLSRGTPRDLFEQLFEPEMRLFEPDSLFRTTLPDLFRRSEGVLFPPMNVAEDANGYDVTVEMPGLEEDDIQVEVLGRQLVVSAERTWRKEDEEKQYHRIESRYGVMQRSMSLPEDALLDLDKVEAKYDKGVLRVRVPKAAPTPKRRIAVKGA